MNDEIKQPEEGPTFDEMYPEEALRGKCHKCLRPFSEPNGEGCTIDHAGQMALSVRYYEEGDDPEHHRCRRCSAIYDGGMRCTYCGDSDPEDTGETAEEIEADLDAQEDDHELEMQNHPERREDVE